MAEQMSVGEAIRLGSTVLRETRGAYCDVDMDGQACGACVIGTALMATGRIDRQGALTIEAGSAAGPPGRGLVTAVHRAMEALWPWLALPIDCPVPGCDRGFEGERVSCVAEHLFEAHKWSRPDVADWLDAKEAELAPADAGRAAAESQVSSPTDA